ncbi:MAG: M23 family metallopeptidase [Candidatus Daviesbacteria bacterium]|nr:M23 family metallopeptidase [Candidatus Daviesbacteria bacterium]
MKVFAKNLLSKKVLRGVALNFKLSKIKPRFQSKVLRLIFFWPKLAIVISALIFLTGYFPYSTFHPISISTAYAEKNEQTDEVIAQSFPQPISLPHSGYLSSRFSRFHPGIDIASNLKSAIHPITAGVVEEINYGFLGYGNNVIITHPNDFKSLYGHMGKIFVQKNQSVTAEDVIGEIGLTGFTSGPHTHLEITYQGRYIDPIMILPEIPPMPLAK